MESVTICNVDRDQFKIDENVVVHAPTGTRFWMYPGSGIIGSSNAGSDQRGFDLAEIRRMASVLMWERLK